MKRLEKAQETIYECYQDLQEIGVLTVVPDNDNENKAATNQSGGQPAINQRKECIKS